MELVQHHMPQPLVVDNSEVNVGGELFAGYPGVHGLVAVVVVACGEELLAEIVDGCIVFRESATCVG